MLSLAAASLASSPVSLFGSRRNSLRCFRCVSLCLIVSALAFGACSFPAEDEYARENERALQLVPTVDGAREVERSVRGVGQGEFCLDQDDCDKPRRFETVIVYERPPGMSATDVATFYENPAWEFTIEDSCPNLEGTQPGGAIVTLRNHLGGSDAGVIVDTCAALYSDRYEAPFVVCIDHNAVPGPLCSRPE